MTDEVENFKRYLRQEGYTRWEDVPGVPHVGGRPPEVSLLWGGPYISASSNSLPSGVPKVPEVDTTSPAEFGPAFRATYDESRCGPRVTFPKATYDALATIEVATIADKMFAVYDKEMRKRGLGHLVGPL